MQALMFANFQQLGTAVKVVVVRTKVHQHAVLIHQEMVMLK